MILITIRVTGPILLPETPDCDYNRGEELLSIEKIEALKNSFKNYNIIDYEHEFIDDNSDYFLKDIGNPVRLFTVDKEVIFKDVSDKTVTVPKGTLWLTSDIENEYVEKRIDDKATVAYSVTVAEKEDADVILQAYNRMNTKNANKSSIVTKEVLTACENISTKRALIKDIEDPVLFTVSCVSFPCVGKAMFCKESVSETVSKHDAVNSNSQSDSMTEETFTENTFYENLKTNLMKLRSSKSDEQKNNEGEQMNNAEIDKLLTEKVGAMKTELSDSLDEKLDSFLSKLQNVPVKEEPVEPVVNEPGEPVEPVEPVNPVVNEEPKVDTKGKGNKSFKHEEPTNKPPFATPSQQLSRQNASATKGEKRQMRNEFDVLYDVIKGNASTKSIPTIEDIDYTGLDINTNYIHETYLNLIPKKFRNVFKYSFSEEDSNKAILTTNVFATFVTRLIQSEPIFEDCQYQTGLHGKGFIYDLDNGTYDTEDGHLPENYYYDKDVADDEFDIEPREIKCYTQRRRVTISDRQRLSNVYGDDLVNKVLETSRKKLFRGVYGARVWGDSSLGAGVDKQYTRQDGLLKQAGTQLDSSSDFDVDDILGIFDTMFYALPEESQNTEDYVFYVPTGVRRAFYNHFVKNAGDRRIDLISNQTPLYWNNIPIKISPTLNRADLRNDLNSGDVSIFLTNPENTHLCVGREAGIEQKRNADTSSDTFYETIDTGVLYSVPDYACVATMTKDEYDSLPISITP